MEQTDSEKAVHPEPVNILVLGIDERPEDPGRTDTMILASIDPVKKQVALISLQGYRCGYPAAGAMTGSMPPMSTAVLSWPWLRYRSSWKYLLIIT